MLVAATSVAAPLVGTLGTVSAAADVAPPDDPVCVGGAPDALSSYRAALDRVATEPVDVLAVGDSITEGYGATADSTRWLDVLRRRLQGTYPVTGVPGGTGYVPAWHVMSTPNGWSWGSTSGTWAPTWVSTGFGLGERAGVLDAAGRYAEVSFTGDRAWLVYTQQTTGSPVTITIDDGPAGTLDTAASTTASGRVWDTGPLSSGSHTMRVTASPTPGGTVSAVIDGAMVFDGDGGATPNAGRGVRVWDAGRVAATAPLFLTKPALGFDAVDNVDPDLILIGLGANDLKAAVTPAQHMANLAAMIDRYRTGTPAASHASIALWVEPAWSDITPGAWQPYVDAIHALGREKDVAVIDVHRRLPQGGDPAYFVDSIHLNDAGNAAMADAFADALVDGPACATTQGTVTTSNGSPAAGACVTAYELGATDATAVATTAADGSFSLVDLTPGVAYDVLTSDCSGIGFASTWWRDALDRASSTPIVAGTVDVAVTVTADASTVPATVISGTVADDSGTPLAGVCVYVFPAGTTSGPMVKTLTDGSFAVTGLVSGADYQVGLYDCSGVGYAAEWWRDAPTQAASTTVTPGTSIAPVLSLAPTSISGTVSSDAGEPLAGICVDAFANGGDTAVASATSAADGTFVVASLSPYPTYQLRFTDCSQSAYVTEWWRDATTQADAASIATGAVVTASLAANPVPANVTGTVVSDTGTPLAGICVTAYPVGASTGTTVKTASDGTFAATGLVGGALYDVEFSDCSGKAYATEWWKDAATRSAATSVVPGANLDAVLGLIPTTITGTVASDAGTPLDGICVAAFLTGSTKATSSTKTAANGAFTLSRLSRTATYQLRFTDCSKPKKYATEWWRDSATQSGALAVNPGTAVDARLSAR